MKRIAIVSIAMLVIVAVFSGMANANSIASVSTDKSKYAEGESVMITITNNCRGPLAFSGYSVENEKGEQIYSPLMLGYTHIMKPGGCFTDVWMQNDNNGEMVVPGTYTVRIEQDSVQIIILAAEEPIVELGTDQPLYATGESVVITMSNTGNVNVVVSNGYWIEDSTGATVFSPKMLAYMMPLPPGGCIEYTWDQTDDMGNQVVRGTYAICTMQDRVEITLAKGAQMQVTVGASMYESGESVLITLSNIGDVAGSICNGYWIEDSKGTVVYAPNMPAYMRPLPAGGSVEYTWDQTDDMGNQVAEGTYAICTIQGEITIDITTPNQGMNNGQYSTSNASPESLEMPHQHFTPKPSGLRTRI
jgi:flagellar hook assembly protein FlgD